MLKAWLDERRDFYLLDVRPEHEFKMCHIENAINIPFSMLETDAIKTPQDRPLVVMCHHGVASQHACELLEKIGLKDLHNLEGGIHAWAEQIDSTIPIY